MKIIHTSDWHLGKRVNGVSMIDDQKYILESLITLIEEYQPEVLIIAGDLYDRSIPPTAAVELLDAALSKILVEQGVKIVAISGNHDNPSRVSFAGSVLNKQGLHITGEVSKPNDFIEYENVRFYPIPYTEPSVYREKFDALDVKSHEDMMKKILSEINLSEEYFNICIAHGFVTNSKNIDVSDSVRPLSIGGQEYIDASIFEKFDYVALGHLHRPQKVKEEYIRYSGSLLKYSFSEVNQKKTVTCIEIIDDQLNIEQRKLNIKRDMKIIKGTLDALITKGQSGAIDVDQYYKAILSDDKALIEPMAKLRQVFKHVLKLEYEWDQVSLGNDETSASKDFKQAKPLDLFKNFYNNMSPKPFDAEKEQVAKEIIQNMINSQRRQ